MKTFQIKLKTLLFLLLVGFAFTNCSKDDDGPGDPDPEEIVEPLVLECSKITEATVLVNRGTGIDYIIPCNIIVEAPLTIEPGVTIAFQQDGGLEIHDSGARTGALTAIGTTEKPIVFTGTNQVPGAWRNIVITSGNLNNKLDHCIIEYAGATDGSKPALELGNRAKIEIQNTIIRNNKNDGVSVYSGANIENWSANTITGNQGYPIAIAARKIKFLDGTQSTYTDNGKNQIYVNSGSLYNVGYIEDEVDGPIHTWQNPGIPYFIDERIWIRNDINNGKRGHLKITEGCQLIFAEGYGLGNDGNNTILEILGTPDNRVSLSGQYGAGSWMGIQIKRSNSNLNKIENTTIADAGQSTWSWFLHKGALSLGHQVGETISLNMTNVHITKSAGCGIVEREIRGGSSITYNNVTFSDNVGEDYCAEEGF